MQSEHHDLEPEDIQSQQVDSAPEATQGTKPFLLRSDGESELEFPVQSPAFVYDETQLSKASDFAVHCILGLASQEQDDREIRAFFKECMRKSELAILLEQYQKKCREYAIVHDFFGGLGINNEAILVEVNAILTCLYEFAAGVSVTSYFISLAKQTGLGNIESIDAICGVVGFGLPLTSLAIVNVLRSFEFDFAYFDELLHVISPDTEYITQFSVQEVWEEAFEALVLLGQEYGNRIEEKHKKILRSEATKRFRATTQEIRALHKQKQRAKKQAKKDEVLSQKEHDRKESDYQEHYFRSQRLAKRRMQILSTDDHQSKPKQKNDESEDIDQDEYDLDFLETDEGSQRNS